MIVTTYQSLDNSFSSGVSEMERASPNAFLGSFCEGLVRKQRQLSTDDLPGGAGFPLTHRPIHGEAWGCHAQMPITYINTRYNKVDP